jgi:hypothetical protein
MATNNKKNFSLIILFVASFLFQGKINVNAAETNYYS